MASKTDFAGLKTKVDDLDVGKRKTIPADLSKLSDVVDNHVVKKTAYDKLVLKVNTTDTKMPSTSGLVTKIKCDSEKQGLERKIEDAAKSKPSDTWVIKKTG